MISRSTKLLDPSRSTRGLRDVPRRIGWPEDGEVSFSIRIVIRRNRYITIRSKRKCEEREVFTSKDVPFSGRRPEESDVSFPVSGVISRSDLIRRSTELQRERLT